MKRLLRILGILVVLAIPLIIYISTSTGVDYVHGFGKACSILHDGWRFHEQCGVQVPPNP
jgi:hypothetical protein